MREVYDVVIAGGGPAGSTAGLILARQGFSVCILEKDKHPRHHIGESFLPRSMPLLRELGLEDALRKLPHIPKYGAEFGLGNNPRTRAFGFKDGLIAGFPVFNIERCFFDKMLLDEARNSGAEVYEETPVREVLNLSTSEVRVKTRDREVRGRILLDCSGQGTLIGRHLKTRKGFDDPALQKVAYYQHFENVERSPGELDGHPLIIMCDEGWFWLIGLSPTKTSVGFVSHPHFVKTLNIPPKRLLAWAVARCPIVRNRMRNASGPIDNYILSDFSYRCKPYAGDGYFLVGDAAAFIDPIFSAGVTLAMMGAYETARTAAALLKGEISPRRAQTDHIRYLSRVTNPFWRLIFGYYQHSFRELFMHGQGPFQMQKAVISILAGQVFPRPIWALRWRHRAFEVCIQLQKHFKLVPRRDPCRLVNETPVPIPWLDSASESVEAVAPSPVVVSIRQTV